MRKRTNWIIGIFLFSVFLFGCLSPIQAEEIVIGALSDLTGPTAAGVGEDFAWGINDYWRYVNEEKGGIKGRKVKLLLTDHQYKPPVGLAAIKKFAARDKAVAILLYGAGDTPTYKPTFLEIKIPGIAAQSTNCTNKYIYIAQGTYTVECWGAMDLIKKTHKGPGKPKMALLVLPNVFGRSVVPGAKWYAEKIGIDLAVIEDVSPRIIDAKPILLRLKAKGVQYIYHNNVARPVATFLKDAMAIGYDVKQSGMSYCGESVLFKLAGESIDGFVSCTAFSPFHEKNMDFPRKLVKMYRGGHTPTTTYGASVVRSMIFEEAIKRALDKHGKVNGELVNKEMEGFKDFSVGGILPNITYGPDRRVASFSKKLLKADWGTKRFSSITDFFMPMGLEGMDLVGVERMLEKFERPKK
ncbi:MAG: ABC transporter substrate-binding protein [Deltaproteobacteria bacterium]|nr:ABC transporter substrate-binding protein [Deltaproteobacteria bacterium]